MELVVRQHLAVQRVSVELKVLWHPKLFAITARKNTRKKYDNSPKIIFRLFIIIKLIINCSGIVGGLFFIRNVYL